MLKIRVSAFRGWQEGEAGNPPGDLSKAARCVPKKRRGHSPSASIGEWTFGPYGGLSTGPETAEGIEIARAKLERRINRAGTKRFLFAAFDDGSVLIDRGDARVWQHCPRRCTGFRLTRANPREIAATIARRHQYWGRFGAPDISFRLSSWLFQTARTAAQTGFIPTGIMVNSGANFVCGTVLVVAATAAMRITARSPERRLSTRAY